MKGIKKGKRLLAVALSMLLAFGGLPTAALAEGQPVQATQGLCEHHLEHTADCGYGEGQPCEHKVNGGGADREGPLGGEHTEDCYTDELICGYKVNGGLGRDEEKETTASDSDAEHTHTQECYALDCPHERGEHDADCGYAEAQPCGYTCELCGKTDNEPEPKPGEETEQAVCDLTEGCTLPTGHEGECVTEPGEGEKETACTLTEGCTLPDGHEGECVTELPPANDALAKIITSWTFVATDYSDYTGNEFAMPGASMERQADFDTVVSMLPTGISAEIEGEAEPAQVDITGWSCPEYVQDENGNWPVTGEYVFTAKLRSGYACDPLPTVKALMGGAELYSQTITGSGYSFDPGSGKLTVSSNAGTTEWRKNPYLPNKEIVTKLEITDAVTAIGEHAFLESGIESVTIPNSVTAIGKRAFEGCTSLTSINIPNSVTAIGEMAFLDCTNLANVTLAEGLKAGIGAYAFQDCTSLTSIHIPNSVTAIGEHAFQGCAKLTSVTLAEGLKAGIGASAFQGCTSLTSINIPGSVTAIGEHAFQDCAKLTSVTLAEGLKAGIGASAFRGCTSLTSIHIPGSVTAIGTYAFLDCTNLANVTFEHNSAPSIGSYPFNDTSADLVIHVPVGATDYNGRDWPTDKIVEGSALPLTNLTISGGTITPMFRMGTQTYTATVPATVTSVTVTPSAKGTITVNGQTVASGASSEAIMLEAGKDNEIKIVVKSDDTLSRAYTVTVTREPLIVTDIKEILGVSVPVLGNTPVTTITETAQYTGTVSWNPNHSTFAADTNYTATITLTPKAGYTLLGVAENFFTVTGATSVTNAENSGVITAVFPKTDKAPIDLKAIEGIAAPVRGNTPVTTITETAQYTGTVSWNPNDSTFAADTNYTATITLTPKAGYTLQGVAENFFTVDGAAPVTNAVNSGEITAVFPKTDKQVYTVTVETSGNGTASTSSINAAEGETVILSATADSGYHFKEWQVISGGITITNNQFLMPAGDVTVRAVFEKDSSGSSGGGGSGSSSDSTVTAPKDSYTSTGTQIGQSVSRSDLQRLANAGKSLTIQSGTAAMTFDPAALKAILAAVPATAGNITFAAVPADISAFPDTAALIGTRPAYSFTISYKDSKGSAIPVNVNFPAGSASISLNYAPAEGEVTGSLFMVYVDGKGAVTWLDKSSYDNGKVLAEVPHFSVYGVAYKTPVPVFTDITDHWAKADMEFVAARGLLSGTGNNLFSPDGTMTRGMFVTALGRLAGVNPDSYQTRSFIDVKADAYYAAYVEWAAQKNIVKGAGEGLFSPDAPVTREQMAVMMTNYAGQMGYSIPTPLAAVAFADNANISAWAAKEVAAMQRAGIIKGKDGNRFDPQASATRAEMSAVLRRFVEIVIDPATAVGWVKNDSGQWLYYKDGKALTDWNQIGGKWYYFDKNGVVAVNTKVDGYEIGPDGVRKE